MDTPVKHSKAPSIKAGLLVLSVMAVVAAILLALRHPEQKESRLSESQLPAAGPATNLPAKSVVSVATKPTATNSTKGVLPNWSNFQERPFPVAEESSNFQWTSEDAMDTNVIRQLAHNELEYQRMVQENPRILRRQLVYLKETVAGVMEQARAGDEPVKQLTLPRFDGKELQFDIVRADLEPSEQVGTFTGRLPNRPDSMVTLSYRFGREAFTVLSPEDGIYLQAWPREPGQILLTSFEPDTYLSLPEGEPIKTTNTFKIAQ